MPRPRYPRGDAALPEPLPPAERTIGQLVAEALRLYGRRFWPSLALGLPVAAVNVIAVDLSGGAAFAFLPVSAVLLAAALVGASVLAAGSTPPRERVVSALVTGFLVFLPFPFLVSVFILPGLAWLAFFGLAVPAVVVEGLDVGGGFRRALALARADVVHALGSLSTFAILLFISQYALFVALNAQGEQTARAAAFLAGAVVSPLLFLGAALLYFDQAARLVKKQAT